MRHENDPSRRQGPFGRAVSPAMLVSAIGVVALAGLLAACTTDTTSAGASENKMPEDDAPQFATAAGLYRQNCAACHGQYGDGNGPGAQTFAIRPRDFRHESIHFISTTSGGAPAPSDLIRTIKRGIRRAGMPPNSRLEDAQLVELANYLREIRRIGLITQLMEKGNTTQQSKDEGYGDDDAYGGGGNAMTREQAVKAAAARLKPGPVTEVPLRPDDYQSNRDLGRKLFVTNCAKCHGQEGRGDGPLKVVDELNRPIHPRDLALGRYSGGGTDRDFYWRIRLGIPGTPMPGNAQLSDDDVWQLIDYVRLLARGGL